MKEFLVALLFFTAFVTHVNGQGAPDVGGDAPDADAGGDVPDADMPDAGDVPEENMPEAEVSVDTQGAIDIEAIKCLCDLQVSADTSGSVEASVSGGGDCGLGDPAPKLGIDCDAVLDGKAEGAFFYILEVQRNGIWGGGGSIGFEEEGYEKLALTLKKGVSEEKDFTIFAGRLSPDGSWKEVNYDLEDENPSELSLCKNDQTPGSWEYTLVEMSNQVILDGRGCPLEEGTETSRITLDENGRPVPFPPVIYQFPEMLPCDRMSWDVKMKDSDKAFMFQVWYDFTPKGLCKPSAPKN